MSTCPECFEDTEYTCNEVKRIAELEGMLKLVTTAKDVSEQHYRARIEELEGDKYASEIPCYWVWDESRQEYTTSCLFGVTYADCDYCPKCGRKVDKCVKPTGGVSK